MNPTIAGVDDVLAASLRGQATAHGRSVEADALAILRHGLTAPQARPGDLYTQIAQWAAASDAVVARLGAPGGEYDAFQ